MHIMKSLNIMKCHEILDVISLHFLFFKNRLYTLCADKYHRLQKEYLKNSLRVYTKFM